MKEKKEKQEDGTWLMPEKQEGVKELSMQIASDPDQEFTSPVPTDQDQCMALIEHEWNTLRSDSIKRSWRIGQIVCELVSRGNADASEAVATKLGVKIRSIQYCTAFYKRYPDFVEVKNLSTKLDWTQAKELSRIKDEKDRKKLVTAVLNDKVKQDEVAAAVNEIVSKDKTTKTDPTTAAEKPVVEKSKKLKLDVEFGKLDLKLQKLYSTMINEASEIETLIAYMDNQELVTQAEFDAAAPFLAKTQERVKSLKGVVDRMLTSLTPDGE